MLTNNDGIFIPPEHKAVLSEILQHILLGGQVKGRIGKFMSDTIHMIL
jgi:hypothetical protein